MGAGALGLSMGRDVAGSGTLRPCRSAGGRLVRPWAAATLVVFLASSAQAGFTDVTDAAGLGGYVQFDPANPESECLTFPSPFSCETERLSGGAATADVDGDGWPDLYVTRLDAPDLLFRNRGDGTFEDFTTTAGLSGFDLQSNGANFADVDNDGDPDLYVLVVGLATDPVNSRFYLFINDGSGHFTEEAAVRGAAVASDENRGGFSVAVGDYDRDGFVDLYTTDWATDELDEPHGRLLRNRGVLAPGHFEDVTDAAGVRIDPDPACAAASTCETFGFAPAFVDLDGDGWLDLAVAADFGTSRLFWNDGDGTFTDGTVAAGVGTDENGMGSTFGDYDGDGDLDWFVTSIFDPDETCDQPGQQCNWGYTGNRLYRNLGGRLFEDATDEAGVRDGYWGWGAAFFDFDNDADLDLAMTNGVEFPILPEPQRSVYARFDPDPMRMWRNDGAGAMPEVSAGLGLTDLGSGKGLLTFDYDRDGDLDLFVANNAATGVLYRNDEDGGNEWLRVRIAGGPGFNADGIGAVVTLQADPGGPVQVRHVGASSHFLGESERTLHFGLGDHPGPIHQLTATWPGLGTAIFGTVAVNQEIVLVPPVGQPDGDGDGLSDADEAVLGTNPAAADSDGDGLSDGQEIGSVASPRDSDGDGTIDALDADDDGDGVPTRDEDANGNGNPADDDADGDGTPDYLEVDADADGIDDADDNCPGHGNPGQEDANVDGIGDVCQPDDADGDGWPNTEDNCPVVANPLQEDADLDGIGDACEDDRSVARQWNEELLNAIRRDFARPTVHARNLFHVSAAMWDAWAAYATTPAQVLHEERSVAADVPAARARTISYAAYRILSARFAASPGASFSQLSFDARMAQLGYDPSYSATSGGADPAAELGNRIAESVLAFGLTDGSNEQGGYANQYYEPSNPPLIVTLPGNPGILFPNLWQPLALDFFIDQSGNPIPGGTPPFLSPEWGQVVPFSLAAEDAAIFSRGGFDYWVYHDPGPPPLLGTPTAEDYLDGFEMVALWSSHLDPADGVMWDISPASNGNAPLPEPDEWRTYYDFEQGGGWGTGHAMNPATGLPYEPQVVPRADYARVLAEFWADGPDSETPPGHWFAIANYVSDNLAEKRIGGRGPLLDDLEWDVKLYLALGGTMHDVAVAVWGMKGWYDYVRPVSALRAMAERGQRSDPGLPRYDAEGFELRPGFIELVTAASSAPGERHEHLAEHVNEIAVLAWRGPDFIVDPEVDVAGVDWILAKDWWPYQRPSFVSPPFAGFPSGHSAYSRAAAMVLDSLTGSPYFPGGYGEFEAPKDAFLVFEDGPSVPLKLQYATYYDASDQTSLSRIWGGIHPPQDDIVSRHIGARIAFDALLHVTEIFTPPPPPQCADGVDNDLDGLVDFGQDPDCASPEDDNEWPMNCGLGGEVAPLLSLILVMRNRRRRGGVPGATSRAPARS